MPVDGPARWMSQMISGSSTDTASPMVSCFSTIPGPEVVLTPRAPPKAAPSAAPTPPISSSAWNVRTPNRLCLVHPGPHAPDPGPDPVLAAAGEAAGGRPGQGIVGGVQADHGLGAGHDLCADRRGT